MVLYGGFLYFTDENYGSYKEYIVVSTVLFLVIGIAAWIVDSGYTIYVALRNRRIIGPQKSLERENTLSLEVMPGLASVEGAAHEVEFTDM